MDDARLGVFSFDQQEQDATLSTDDYLEEIAMSGVFDEDLFKIGLERRKATLGEDYVSAAMDGADAFTRAFQEGQTAWAWGFGWGDDAIDAKTRSMMNLAMLGALGRMHEFEIHCRGALTNGVSKEQIRAICHVVAIYAGVPMAHDCFRSARKVLQEANVL